MPKNDTTTTCKLTNSRPKPMKKKSFNLMPGHIPKYLSHYPSQMFRPIPDFHPINTFTLTQLVKMYYVYTLC